MTETLHGVPVPELTPREAVVLAVHAELGPVRELWESRSGDMLAVLADAAEARAQVRAAARTIRLAAWLGVLAVALTGYSVWAVLDGERTLQRRQRELDRVERQAALEELGRRINRACLR